MTDEPKHDSDDQEAERLIAEYGRAVATLCALQDLPPTDDKYKQAERARDERVARGEMERIQRALDRLHLPSAGIDFTEPKRTPPEQPLLPGPPSWRTGFPVAAEELVAAEVEKAHKALDANKRAEGPRITALQVVDHHLARDEPLPPRALELLGRALPIDPKRITAWHRWEFIRRADAAGRDKQDTAAELGISDRAARLLREPKEKPEALLNYAAVATASAADEPPRRSTRDAIARLLGLLDSEGRFRREVVTTVHAGLRQPAMVLEAARIEAQRRAHGKARNNASRVASAMRAAAHEERKQAKKQGRDPKPIAKAVKTNALAVAGWMDPKHRPIWEMAVLAEGVWLRGGLRPSKKMVIRRGEVLPREEA